MYNFVTNYILIIGGQKEVIMSFEAAKCPQCGGELQLDIEKETAFCMHCGSKIIVQEAIRAVRIDNAHMVDTWIKMGKSAFEAKLISCPLDLADKITGNVPEFL